MQRHLDFSRSSIETTRRRLNCEKLGTSHNVKGFALLVHFWRVLVLKEQMMTSVRKTLKHWSHQRRSDRFLAKFALKITTKSAVFYRLLFGEVCLENSREMPAKSADFSANLSLKMPRNLTFFSATYQKPWLYHE